MPPRDGDLSSTKKNGQNVAEVGVDNGFKIGCNMIAAFSSWKALREEP